MIEAQSSVPPPGATEEPTAVTRSHSAPPSGMSGGFIRHGMSLVQYNDVNSPIHNDLAWKDESLQTGTRTLWRDPFRSLTEEVAENQGPTDNRDTVAEEPNARKQ